MEMCMHAKDADTLDRIAQGVEAGMSPAASASALRDIAQRLRAAAPATDEAPASADAAAPADATPLAPADAKAAVVAMANGCADCRAKVTGEPPSHDLDMIRHEIEGHAARLAELLKTLRAEDVAEPE
jgi:hypothetical protein